MALIPDSQIQIKNVITMFTELFKKNHGSILKYLTKLGRKSAIYSECRKGLGPLFPDKDFYVYATEAEIAIVLIDSGSAGRSAEKDEMVWDLALTCELFRHRFMRLSKHVPQTFGILVTADHVADTDEMRIDIAVIGNVDGLDHLALPVNSDSELSIAFPLQFLYQAEFTEADLAFAEYSLISLIDPNITQDERTEEMNYLMEEFCLE